MTIGKLEFDRVREALAGYCGTGLGKRLALSVRPTIKAKQVREWLSQVRELTSIVEEGSPPPLGGVHDVREQVRSSAFPTPLEPEVLASIAETMAATGPLRSWFEGIAEVAPVLSKLADQVHDLMPLGEAIWEKIESRGHVRDHASPRLASIRGAIERARSEVRVVFDRILRRTSLTRMLQYGGATFHSDRMVLPLKAEHRGRIPGIIHRTSDSGATLFVEPSESVELNNSIVRLREEESKEVTRILRELSQEVHAHVRPIMVTLRAIGAVDLIVAKHKYAKKRRCVCPEVDDTGVLDLHEARHPLLVELFDEACEEGTAPREVVPIDIRLGDDFDILVITGPNTGGKTVAIKTLGLIAIMTQCGIPIPAGEGSRMPVFHNIVIDIGDEQSLQQSLSTFSSHLETQLDIIGHSGPRTLVLVDELGAGTDPDEGAAIGRAILSELLRLGAKAVVTTHLSALKAVAYTTDRVDNASVEFDAQTLRPTFHLRLGEPGNSNALIIAKRLGMPARLVKTAKGFLDDRTRALNQAIQGTLQSRREAESARKAAREAKLEAGRERDMYERDRDALRRQQDAYEQWTKWIDTLRSGDPVYLKSLKRPAKVVRMELHKQRALVSTGALDIEVPLRDIDAPRDED